MAKAKKEKVAEQSAPTVSDSIKARLKCVYGENQPNDVVKMSKADYKTLYNLGFAEKV